MMEVTEAVAAVLREASPFEQQAIPLLEALGLVLATAVCADADSPPFDKSLVDGFAVRLTDCARSLPVIETVAAGQVPTRSLDHPAAIQIMTGAPLPKGAEAVVPVEHTSQEIGADGRPLVSVPSKVVNWKLDTNVLRRGASMKLGDLVVAAGSELRPQELGALAESGLARVIVRRRPRVAVLATGDELVPVEQTPGPGQIRNSNETMLCAQIRRANAESIPLGIARDERAHLRERIEVGLNADVLVLSGGVSMGDKDLVPSELAAAGVRQVFHKVNVKPGKPIWFGVLDRRVGQALAPAHQTGVVEEGGPALRWSHPTGDRCLVFGLPGNPVSSLVCFELFVRPALRQMMGASPAEPVVVKARLTAPHTTKGDRPTYQPARLEWRADGPIVTAVPWVGSSDLRATVAANSMALFPVGDQTYEAGAGIDVIAW